MNPDFIFNEIDSLLLSKGTILYENNQNNYLNFYNNNLKKENIYSYYVVENATIDDTNKFFKVIK